MALIPYFELIKVPVQFYKMMGQDILCPDNRPQSKHMKALFYMALINYVTQCGLQCVFFILAIKSSSMLEITFIAPCVGFGFVGMFKQLTLHWNKLKIREVLDDLKDLYPKTKLLQNEYNLKDYVVTLNIVMKVFGGLCLWNTAYFALFEPGKTILAMIFHNADFDYPLSFPMWYPFNVRQNWFVYVVCFWLQVWCATVVGIAILSADLFLVTSLTQLCIQFDYISNKLRNYEPQSVKQDHQFLIYIIKIHTKCLELSETVDVVFRLSLLLNFLTSSGTICFGGFQVMSTSTEDLMRFGVLLATSLAQVMIICIYGNKLIDASLAVGDAAYFHPWYKCDLAYMKMIKLIICRSQRYAAIHAPTFPPISLQTFMKVISMSYQFFAVLQTTYDKQ